ncbi:major facilitator superfamily domain-containing protein [Trichoderma asperelloides]|nr:major facilitator superfamily domain-containing protein [Trichoderma asperelloides]
MALTDGSTTPSSLDDKSRIGHQDPESVLDQMEQQQQSRDLFSKHDASQVSAQPEVHAIGAEGTPGPVRQSGWKWWLICFGVYSTCLMYGLDTTIASVVQAPVVDTFKQVSQVAWIGAGFLLGSTAVILPYGAMFNTFDLKWNFIAGVVLFEGGSALCGGAPNMVLTPPKVRGTYVTGVGFFWGIGCILGPIVGGSLSDSSATWRWAFYINLVIAAVTAPVYLFVLPSFKPSSDQSIMSRLLKLDYLGFALSIGFWVTFALGFLSAGGIWKWSDGRTIATITVFAALLAAYALQQIFSIFTTPERRSFPLHLLKSRTQILLYIEAAAAMAAIYVPIFYIAIYFQFVRNDSSLEAAIRLLPYIIVFIVANLGSGYLLPKVNRYIILYVVAGILLTISGSLLYIYITPTTKPATIYGLSVIEGIGAGISAQVGFSIATVESGPKDAAHALTLQNLGQLGAGVIALVVTGQVYQTTAVKGLAEALSPAGYTAAQIEDAAAGAQSVVFQGLTGDLRDKAIVAVTNAIQRVFILLIVAGAASLIAALGMKRHKLFK